MQTPRERMADMVMACEAMGAGDQRSAWQGEGETWIDVVRCKGSGFMTCSNATGLEGYAAVRIGDDVQ